MDDCQHVWSDDDCCQHCIRCGIGRDVADSESKIAELTAEVERLQTCVHDLKIANSYAVQRIDNLSVDVQTANSRLAEERAEVERLRAALRAIRTFRTRGVISGPREGDTDWSDGYNSALNDMRDVVVVALAGEEE